MKLQILNLFTHTLDALLIFFFLAKILYKKNIIYGKRYYYLVGLIILNLVISRIFGSGEFLTFIMIVMTSTFIYSYLLNEKLLKTLTYTIMGTITLGITEIITVGIIVLAFNTKPSIILEVGVYRILAIIISKGTFFLIIKYLLRSLKTLSYVKIKSYKTIILILIYNVFVIFTLMGLYRHIQVLSIKINLYLATTGILIGLISFTIYTLITQNIYQNQQKLVWNLKEKEFYKNDFYIKSMEDILETIKSQRHDLNNYLSTLYGLIYLKKFDDAKEYINKINGEINNLNVIIDTNHPIITALVSIKKNKTFEHGIDMNLDIELPEGIDFEFVDLSIVIGNLLDNAIEACQSIAKNKERKINFKMHITEEILRIEVKNTKLESKIIENEKFTGRYTTKGDNENHGYGLGNVEFVVKQHNGNMEISDLGDEFIINIDLPINGHKHFTA